MMDEDEMGNYIEDMDSSQADGSQIDINAVLSQLRQYQHAVNGSNSGRRRSIVCRFLSKDR